VEEVQRQKAAQSHGNRPMTSYVPPPAASQVQNFQSGNNEELKKLRLQVSDKDKKATELNDMVSSLQVKLQEKMKEVKNEKSEVTRYKKLAEELENQNIQL